MVKLFTQLQEKVGTALKIRRAFNKVAPYPWSQFSVEDFVTWLQASQGHTLQVRYAPFDNNVFGAWFTYTEPEQGHNEEIFCIDESLTGLQRVHTLLHEVAHWLLGHKTKTITPQALEDFMQEWPQMKQSGVPLRGTDTALSAQQQEEQAERLALLLLEQVVKHQSVAKHDRVKQYLDEMEFFQ